MGAILKILGLLIVVALAMIITAPSNEMAAIGSIGLVAGLILGSTLGYHLGNNVKKHSKGAEVRAPVAKPQPTSADLLETFKAGQPPYGDNQPIRPKGSRRKSYF